MYSSNWLWVAKRLSILITWAYFLEEPVVILSALALSPQLSLHFFHYLEICENNSFKKEENVDFLTCRSM